MTAEILSTLASFRDEIGECSDGKIHSDITTATTTTTTTTVTVGSGLGSHCANISNRPGVYTTHLLKDDTSAHKNIIKQKTTHIHNSMLSPDSSMPCTNTTSTSTFASSSNSSTTTNTTTTIDQCRLQITPFVQTHHHHHHHHPHHHHLGAGNSGLCTNSSVPTVYSSCLHHVGDKIGISMSPNDYRLLTDPRLINYVTDKETEAKLINQ
ncbi:unnamed protein product [Schistosoma turkestanicum]|nr:unnamed protein product [Schistosoma turkestanicum]